MLTVDDYGMIRRAFYQDGLSRRAIERTYGYHRKTIGKALAQAEPPRYQRSHPPPAPMLGAYHDIIDQILASDVESPRKQRHTMAQVYRRLVGEHGYSGGYDAVRRYIGRLRQGPGDTDLPLEHAPGVRLEADFGHIQVDFPDGRREVPLLVCTWSYSNAPFALALPTERTEAVLAGMVAAFEFYGCVPREVWWDNPRSVVTHIGRGRERVFHERYRTLASWYCFTPCACMAQAPKEKPRVENRVFDLQRRWSTPVPGVADLAELNQDLRAKCLKERDRKITRATQTIGERFAVEQAAALSLPPTPFLAVVYQEAAVDRYQQVRYDNVFYSVPHRYAFGRLTVRAGIDQIEVLRGAQVVASHARCYEPGAVRQDPLHYLPTLQRKPAYLDQTRVYRDWVLPAEFEQLRRALEARHGQRPGQRQYIGVLQLLADHPQERVQQVIARHLGRGSAGLDTGAIRLELERRALADQAPAPRLSVTNVVVPAPDLSLFDQLLSHGGSHHE